jgi:hypothetical protein
MASAAAQGAKELTWQAVLHAADVMTQEVVMDVRV